jgi:hypothetical protein
MINGPNIQPDIFTAKFSTGDLAKAADVTTDALQTWIRRGHIVGADGIGIDMPGSPGFRRAFSFENVMEVAVGAALIKGGNAPAEAFKAARKFAYGLTDRREPGRLFDDGMTLLFVDGDRCEVVTNRGSSKILGREINLFLGGSDGFDILLVNTIFDRAVQSLNRTMTERLGLNEKEFNA